VPSDEQETPVDENELTKPGTSTIDHIIEIITKRLEWPTESASPDPSTLLGDDGIGFDSLMIVEFALDLEEEFDIEIGEDEMLDIGTMSISQVADLIESRTTDSPA
jgi:acyl carrier protein